MNSFPSWCRRSIPVFLLLGACGDGSEPVGARPMQAPARSVAVQAADRPDEAQMAALARAVPGLGGYYHEADGGLVVHLTDLGRAENARQVLEGVLGARGDMRPRQARFTFLQLQAWRDAISEAALALEGVAFVDLDEERNQVAVGLAHPGARGAVLALATRSGVPADALAFPPASYLVAQDTTVYGPYLYTAPQPATTIIGYRRPLEGGLRLAFRRSGMTPTQHTICTLGFVASREGVRVLTTNSHCSDRSWDREQTAYFQPEPGDGRFVGYEGVDPNGSSCGFLSPNVCRDADAAAVFVELGVATSLGYIARPQGEPPVGRPSFGTYYGPTTVDPATPVFAISGKGTLTTNGEVHKVGSVTGWTAGRVLRTCVDTKVAYRDWSVLRCQAYASYSSTGGDSGAPVFMIQPDGTVLLLGLHWGEAQDRSYASFSPIGRIQSDLGSLTVAVGGTDSGGTGGPGGVGTPPGGNDGGCSACVN